MVDVSLFLRLNNLKQKQLAQYLGVTETTVSKLVKGQLRLSDVMMSKIMGNDYGWDVSMLTTESTVGDIVGNKGPVSVDQSKHMSTGDSKKELGLLIKIAELEKENEQLKERLADKDAQIQEERKRFMDLLEIYKTK